MLNPQVIAQMNSNTTLVKVKLYSLNFPFQNFANSNTTLVKVKFSKQSNVINTIKFKYNTC